MPDARCTRDLVCNVHKKCAHEHTGQRRTSDIPCAMALRLITRSPGEPCTVATVDANIGASDHTSFAVRFGRARQSQPPRPPQPAPRRDDGRRPLWVGRDGDRYTQFLFLEKRNIFDLGA